MGMCEIALWRFPRSVGSVGQFYRSMLSIRPAFPPLQPISFSVRSLVHKLVAESSCSRVFSLLVITFVSCLRSCCALTNASAWPRRLFSTIAV